MISHPASAFFAACRLLPCLLLVVIPLRALSQDEAISPKQTINLLDVTDPSDLVVHLNEKASLTTEQDEIWYFDENGHLRVSGLGMGYIRTRQAWRDYHLVIEYQWGERTHATRSDRARDCGLLIHSYGDDGAYGGTWMNCIEAQLIEGGSGDILVLAAKDDNGDIGPTRITAEVTRDRDDEPVWTPGGETETFPPDGKTMGRVNWKDRDPDWTDVRGYRGANDIENPVGEWNRMEVICDGDRITIFLNGVKVNEVTGCHPSEGFIGLQSEYAECRIRRLELHPLGTFDVAWDPEERATDMGYSITGESILPRRFPLSAEESAALWEIDGPFDLQLVANEPLTCDPVDVCWDEKGRLFVAEMGDYPLPADDTGYLSRIRLLTDEDGDGRMDRAVTWANDLDHVQGLLPHENGILATTRTAILFLADTDGDDVADERTVLFRSNEPRHNQLQVSSPRRGVDNAIYLNNGLDGKEIYPEGAEDAVLDFTRQNLRYHPASGALETISGRGQYGGSLDDFDRHFFCTNRNPAIFGVMPLAAVKRNPTARILTGYEDIQAPGAPVWPVALSHTTSAAHAGTHTAACGLGVYRGGLISEMTGNLFVCDPTAQLVTRSELVPHGATFVAERIGEKRDFLASGDEWTRPVNVRNGPDGALYVVDMYRRFIDHSRFFPEDFSESHYMRAGLDQGRIWRLVPKGASAPTIDPLPQTVAGLVSELSSPHGWRRTNAQRILVERKMTEAEPAIRSLLHKHETPKAQAHAFGTLAGLGLLTPEDVMLALGASESGVVEVALSWSARDFFADEAVRREVRSLTADPRPRVRFLAISLFPGEAIERSAEELASLLAASPGDTWLRRAIMSAHGSEAGPILAHLLQSGSVTTKASDAATALLTDLASLAAANGDLAGLSSVADALTGDPSWWHFAVVTGWSEGQRRSSLPQKSLAAFIASPPEDFTADASAVARVLDEAAAMATDRERSAASRIAALPLVAQGGFDTTLPIVEKLIDPAEPAAIQEAACRTLSRFDRVAVAEFFFARWNSLPPAALREALALITGSTKSGLLLMKKMEAGDISKSLMPPMTRWSYGRSSNEEIKTLAQELFGEASSDRAAVINDYREALGSREGDADKGKAVFAQAACITCHQMGEAGVDVGPSLADVRMKPAEALLTDILDPNRAVEDRWVSAILEKKDGATLSGLVAGDDDTGVTLRVPGGAETFVPRGEIATFRTTGLSLMPVGLEGAISKDDMIDLLAYLRKR